MLGLRWLKRTVFIHGDTRRYIGYAVGEILLVIVGILIALQIDNWNSERQDRATLDNYLRAIAGNMREDMVRLEALSTERSETILLATNAQALLYRPSFNVEEILYLAQAMGTAERFAYFDANTSGFDALKTSGVLDELQGKDVEMLLSRYYVAHPYWLKSSRFRIRLPCIQDGSKNCRNFIASTTAASIPDDCSKWRVTRPQSCENT
jgi:hypothetical protein